MLHNMIFVAMETCYPMSGSRILLVQNDTKYIILHDYDAFRTGIVNNHYICPFHCIDIDHQHVSEQGHTDKCIYGGTGSSATNK